MNSTPPQSFVRVSASIAFILLTLLAFRTPQDETSAVDAMIDRALNGSPAIRPQAAVRLVHMGEVAVERLLEMSGETTRDFANLGNDLVGILGRFDSPRLRQKLWSAVEDSDFPWRPAAARSLATTAKIEELEAFTVLLGDRISIVRGAAVESLFVLNARDSIDRVRAALGDSDDRVRRIAASVLVDWGEWGATAYLLEEFKRLDTFFDRPTGAIARVDAFKKISDRLPETFDYNVRKRHTTAENREAFEKIVAACKDRAGDAWPEIPKEVQAETEDRKGDLLGIELRSCRHGEYFLRWNADDHLYIGTGHPTRVPLKKGTVDSLTGALREVVKPDGNRRFWGEAGCDMETIYFRPSVDDRPKGYSVSKGPDPNPELRPPMLRIALIYLLASLDEVEDENFDVTYKQKLRDALESVGGPLQ